MSLQPHGFQHCQHGERVKYKHEAQASGSEKPVFAESAESLAGFRSGHRQEPAQLMFAELPKSVIAEKIALIRKQSRGPCHY